jgi:hypothetical protein
MTSPRSTTLPQLGFCQDLSAPPHLINVVLSQLWLFEKIAPLLSPMNLLRVTLSPQALVIYSQPKPCLFEDLGRLSD